MALVRSTKNNDDPPPVYNAIKLMITLRLHYGGTVSLTPTTTHVGGSLCVIDYVGPNYMTLRDLTKFCCDIGFVGVDRFYLKEPLGDGISLRLLWQDVELKRAFLNKVCLQNENVMNIYVECNGRVVEQERLNEGIGRLASEGLGIGMADGLGDSVLAGEGQNSGPEVEVEQVEEENQVEYDSEKDLEHFSDSDFDFELDSEEENDSETENEAGGGGGEENEEGGGGGKENEEGGGGGEENEAGGGENAAEAESDSENENLNAVSDSGSENIARSGDEFDSARGSDSETEKDPFPVFNISDIWKPTFKPGMKFATKSLLRDAIHSNAICTRRNLKITKNDKKRLHAKCCGRKCKWRLHAVPILGEVTFRINEYFPKHKCPALMKVKNLKAKWLARKFLHWFKTDPNRSVLRFKNDATKKTKCNVSKQQAYRGKVAALKILHGNSFEQYSLLWDYIEEVKRTNPGSTIVLGTYTSMFDRIYFCLKALRDGFLTCRKFIGVDGCHLKGPHKGVLLTAVGVDANNNIFPFAWAVVNQEDGENWEWFLHILRMDLGIVENENWTFMSDKQKGLLQAFQLVFPGSDHRFCVRHLHCNFKRVGFPGEAFKEQLWRAARACTLNEWQGRMKHMATIDPAAAKWFEDKPPEQWSRSHFSTKSKCDLLLNNGCEVFNACILEARRLPILSMLCWIMEYMMKRMQKNRDRARQHWKGTTILCPKIRGILDNHLDNQTNYTAHKSDDWNYQVDGWDGSSYAVDLEEKKCGCRKWDVSGIPCVHVVVACATQGIDEEEFVDECYHKATYESTYKHVVRPINGRTEWRKTNFTPPLPPNDGRGLGRSEEARRVEPDEPKGKKKRKCRGKPVYVLENGIKTKRHQRTVKCSYCRGEGHNVKGCEAKKSDMQQRDQESEGGGLERLPVIETTPVVAGSSKNNTKKNSQGKTKSNRKSTPRAKNTVGSSKNKNLKGKGKNNPKPPPRSVNTVGPSKDKNVKGKGKGIEISKPPFRTGTSKDKNVRDAGVCKAPSEQLAPNTRKRTSNIATSEPTVVAEPASQISAILSPTPTVPGPSMHDQCPGSNTNKCKIQRINMGGRSMLVSVPNPKYVGNPKKGKSMK